QGASTATGVLLLAYAAGAATSLALALAIGGRVFVAMKRSLHVGEWVRRGLGALVLFAVAAIAFGLDTDLLTRVSLASTTSLEQGLLDRFQSTDGPRMSGGPAMMMSAAALPKADQLPVEDIDVSYAGATSWLNSPPLTADGLEGKVVVVDFWTYSCINCLRS